MIVLTISLAMPSPFSSVQAKGLALALGLALLLLAGCPEKASPAKPDAAACTKVGQSCEYAAGKLGSCVQQDDCATPPCLVCQSQH